MGWGGGGGGWGSHDQDCGRMELVTQFPSVNYQCSSKIKWLGDFWVGHLEAIPAGEEG